MTTSVHLTELNLYLIYYESVYRNILLMRKQTIPFVHFYWFYLPFFFFSLVETALYMFLNLSMLMIINDDNYWFASKLIPLDVDQPYAFMIWHDLSIHVYKLIIFSFWVIPTFGRNNGAGVFLLVLVLFPQ